jgi:hypothetical protein
MKRYLIIAAMAVMALATSCVHKDLCEDHREHAHRYHINIIADYRYDWEEHIFEDATDWEYRWPDEYMPYDLLRPTKPGGLRVVNYNSDGDYNRHNISPDGGVITLYEGKNDLLFYNNDTEYIIFSRTNGASTRATTRTRTRADYKPSRFADSTELTVSPPDMLFANYIENYVPAKVVEPVEVEVELQPLVFTYKCRFEFGNDTIPDGNLKYVALAKADLSGMAASVLLETGETSEDAVTILSEDAEVTDWGVRSCIRSFGIPAFPNPNYPTRGEARHALVLHLRLKNGDYVSYDFDVTDQVTNQPHGGVIVVKDIAIPDDVVSKGSGAFDVVVDDWGPYEEIDLLL